MKCEKSLIHDNLYDILGIDENLIVAEKSNINYWLNQYTELLPRLTEAKQQNKVLAPMLSYINNAILIAEKFHSYFHFEQSFAYTIAAYCQYIAIIAGLAIKESISDYIKQLYYYIDKALVQDHLNLQIKVLEEIAKQIITTDTNFSIQRIIPLAQILSYNKDYRWEKDFLEFATSSSNIFINERSDIMVLDNLLTTIYQLAEDLYTTKGCQGAIQKIEANLEEQKKIIFQSHRLYVGQAVLEISKMISNKKNRPNITFNTLGKTKDEADHLSDQLNSIARAQAKINKAITIIERGHQRYHKFASTIYNMRANIYSTQNEYYLAQNDKIKADNLDT